MNLGGKRLLLLGIIFVLLVAIPITIYLASQQQEVRSHATPSTTIAVCASSATSVSSCTSQVNATVGQSFSVDVVMNPGQNLVSFVKLQITYDASKLDLSDTKISPNTSVATSLTEPVYTPGNAVISLGIVVNSSGVDPTKIIQTPTKIATITFTPKAAAPAPGTNITIGNQTQVLSTRCDQTDPNNCPDQQGDNVLSSSTPAQVTIAGGTAPTPTPGGGGNNPTPTPGGGSSGGGSTGSGGGSSGGGTGSTGATNQPPVCSSFTVDNATGTTAPFSVVLTAIGNDPDGTIAKVTFDYGDGIAEDVAGTGTAAVSVQKNHTYTANGTYVARAIITDNGNAQSGAQACTQTITVGNVQAGSGTSGGDTGGGGQAVQQPPNQGTLPATGPGDMFLGIGAAGVLLSILGGVLFFVL